MSFCHVFRNPCRTITYQSSTFFHSGAYVCDYLWPLIVCSVASEHREPTDFVSHSSPPGYSSNAHLQYQHIWIEHIDISQWTMTIPTICKAVFVQNWVDIVQRHSHIYMRINQTIIIIFRIRNTYTEQTTILTENWSSTLAGLHTGIGEDDAGHCFCDAPFENAGQEIVQPTEAGEMRKARCVDDLTCKQQ